MNETICDQLLTAPTLWQLLERRVALTPDATMLVEADGASWTFSHFAREATRTAAALHALGIGAGSSVTWQLPTGARGALLSLALARLGAVQNPIIHLYGRKEVSAILAHNRSAFFLVPAASAAGADHIEQAHAICAALAEAPLIIGVDARLASDDIGVLPAPAGDSARWVFYTSGSTAEPKGALHTDATLMAAGLAYAGALGVSAADVGTIAFPYAHVGGVMNIAMLMSAGMSAVLLPKFAAAEAAAIFSRHGVTVSSGSTAHYLAFLAEQRNQPGMPLIPSLRILSGGGAPKPSELYYDAKRELRCTIAHSYGMTESPMITGASPRHTDEQLADSDGAPIPGMQVRIVRPDGLPAAPGEAGEIRIQGPTVCKGYTSAALTADAFDADGFFRTGDLGVRRADGHITLTGRIKDVIIRKGENISAREIEDILHEHPKVAAVAVIGLPDSARGERVCAVIELRDPSQPLSFDEMVAFFKAAGTMRQKIPEQLEVLERLPRNETFNKILKFKLRDMFSATQGVM